MAKGGSGDTRSAPLVLYRWLGLSLGHQFCPNGALQLSLETLCLTPVWPYKWIRLGLGTLGLAP